MEMVNEFHCFNCNSSESNYKPQNTRNILERNLNRKEGSHSKLFHRKSSSMRTQNFNLNYYSGIFIFILGLLFMISGAQTQSLNADENATDLSDYNNNNSMSNNTVVHDKPSRSATPRVEAVVSQRKYTKCPKKYRHSFCMNEGRCHWVAEIEKPTCRCKKTWEGERCEKPRIDLTRSDEKHNSTIIIVASVVSCVVFAVLVTIFCICWRRIKSVRRELELQEVDEKEKSEKLISENVNGLTHSTSIVMNT